MGAKIGFGQSCRISPLSCFPSTLYSQKNKYFASVVLGVEDEMNQKWVIEKGKNHDR